MGDRRKEQNDMLIARVQGVPAQSRSLLDAMLDPSSWVQRYEANDNDIERATPSSDTQCSCEQSEGERLV